MSNSEIIVRIKDAMKTAMRNKDKARLGTIRMMQAEFKRIEVDERIELDDERVISILDKMCKQRRDAEAQYKDADREDLAIIERNEIEVIEEFLPAQLSEDELITIIDQAISDTGAEGMAAMGKAMGLIKPQVQGRADMGKVSQLVKQRLN